jgi:hypothetical protein
VGSEDNDIHTPIAVRLSPHEAIFNEDSGCALIPLLVFFFVSPLPLSGVVKIRLELEAMGALSFLCELRPLLLFSEYFASSHLARIGLGSNSGIKGPREQTNGKNTHFKNFKKTQQSPKPNLD